MPADRGGGGERGEYFVLPGVYENSHRVREAWSIGFDDDPRFDDEDGYDPAAVDTARAAAAAAADAAADEKIREGKPIVATLLNPGWSLHPFRRTTFSVPRVPFFSRDWDLRYDVYADDRVVVNVVATERWKA